MKPDYRTVEKLQSIKVQVRLTWFSYKILIQEQRNPLLSRRTGAEKWRGSGIRGTKEQNKSGLWSLWSLWSLWLHISFAEERKIILYWILLSISVHICSILFMDHHGSSWIIMDHHGLFARPRHETPGHRQARHRLLHSPWRLALRGIGIILSGNSTIVGISWLKLIPAIS